ncbi:MAG TPA: DUF4388 domain-containing protein [Myxococcaceae bacterium]|jgi:CheY-like chemotaxis protein
MARLIIVEDNSELAFLIVSAARARGHEATAVGGGRAALQALAGGATFDAAVVDLLLPDMGGGEVLQSLKAAGIPAVAMSGVYRGEQHALHTVEHYGASKFFEKPFDMRALLQAVEAAAAAAGVQPAVLIEDEEDDLAELEELTPLQDEEEQHDEPLSGQAVAPELDDEPTTPTRPLDQLELTALAHTAAPVGGEEEASELEDDIPTRVMPPPVETRPPEQDAVSPEDEVTLALEALEAIDAPMSMVEAAVAAAEKALQPPAEPRPARGPGGAIGMAHELAVRVSHRPPEKVAADLSQALSEQAARAADEVEAALAPIEPSEAFLATGQLEALRSDEPPPIAGSPEIDEAFLATGGLQSLGSEVRSPAAGPPEPGGASLATGESETLRSEPDSNDAATEPPEPALETPAPDAVLVPFGERGRVWHRPEHPARKRPLPDWGEAGDLSHSSVPKLLNAFYEARHTGELKLKQDSVLKVVFVENGLPVYAASNLATERYGRFCVRRGAIAEPDLNRVAALAELEGIRTGESMVRLGLLTSDRRRELLEEQVRDIIWSTFSWNRGQYHLIPKKPSRQDLVKLFLFPGELILEGVARTHTLISLRQKMPAGRRLSPTPDPPYLQQEIPLTGPQLALLAASDGSKTVEDLLSLTDLSEREALASLLGFELLGLVVERRVEESKRQRISFGL